MGSGRCIGGAFAVLALAGCIPPANEAPPAPMPSRAPVAVAPPAPVATPAIPLTPAQANWMDAQTTAGDWRWRRAGGESFAEFRTPGGQLLVQFNCTADREMVLAVAHNPTASGSVTIRTETVVRTLAAEAREGWLETRLTARDPLLDAIAFSRGRFAVELPHDNAQTGALYLPAYPEITRVVEDCR